MMHPTDTAAPGPLRRRSSRVEAAAGAGLVVVMVAVLGWALVTFHSFKASTESGDWLTHTYKVREAVRSALSALTDAETSQRGYILTRNPEYLEPYTEAIALVGRCLDQVSSLTRDDPVQQERIPKLRGLAQRRLTLLQEGLARFQESGVPAAVPGVADGRGKAVMDEIRREVDGILQTEQRLLESRGAHEQVKVHQTQRIILLGSAGLLVLLTGLAIFVYREHEARPVLAYPSAAMRASGRWAGYTLAIAGVAVAAWLRWRLVADFGQEIPPFITFYPAIILAALLGGTGAGLLATILSAVTVAYFFLEPAGLEVGRPVDMASLSIFTAVNLMMSVIGGSLHRARNRAAEQASELARTAAIIADSDDAVLARDLQGQITAWNIGAERLFGYRAEHIVGQNFLLLVPPGRHAEEERILAAIRRGEKLEHYESQRLRQDGRLIDLSITTSPIRDRTGQIIGASTIARDITQRKRFEEAVRENEERLRLAVETAELGMYERDLVSNQVTMNGTCRALLGVSDGPLPPDVARQAVHPEDKERVFAAVARAFDPAVREICAAEFRILRPDGTVCWVAGRGQVIFDDEAQPARACKFLGVLNDITERKRAEEALRLSEEKFGKAFAGNLAGLALTRLADGRFLEVNDTWLKLFGYRREEVIGRSVQHELRIWPRLEDRARFVQELREKGSLREWELELVRKSGETFVAQVSVQVLRVRGEEVLLATVLDITEQKRAREALARSREELEQLVTERTAKLQEMVAELEHFSYTITHDMRAPLRAMRGFAGILVEECGACIHGEQLEYLRSIAESADRMDQLITDALQYSLIVRGTFRLEPVDADALARGILASYPQFQPPHARVHIANRLPVVLANNAGLTQCFSNLLGNAIKFVSPGQIPEVLVWSEAAPEEAAGGSRAEPQSAARPLSGWHISGRLPAATKPNGRQPAVRIWFEDKGIGIHEDYHDKIWVMFQRLNKSYEGTGIGLALVRKAVERMGGRVGLESKPGHGSRFWVELQSADLTPQPNLAQQAVLKE
jgi:PAS domain S-box-containing protein